MCASPAYYWVSDQVVYHLRGQSTRKQHRLTSRKPAPSTQTPEPRPRLAWSQADESDEPQRQPWRSVWGIVAVITACAVVVAGLVGLVLWVSKPGGPSSVPATTNVAPVPSAAPPPVTVTVQPSPAPPVTLTPQHVTHSSLRWWLQNCRQTPMTGCRWSRSTRVTTTWHKVSQSHS